MKCIVVTPEKTEVDQEAAFVVVPLYDGEYGVGPGHTPVVGRIGSGELRVKAEDGSVDSFYIEGGFMEVLKDNVSILTNVILRKGQITLQKAEAALETAKAKSSKTPELAAIKNAAISAARSQIHIAQKWEK